MTVSGLMFVYVNELRLSGPFLVDGCTAHVIDPGGGLNRPPPLPFGPDDVLGVGAAGGVGGWGSATAGAAMVAMQTASRPDATASARRRHRISRSVLMNRPFRSACPSTMWPRTRTTGLGGRGDGMRRRVPAHPIPCLSNAGQTSQRNRSC